MLIEDILSDGKRNHTSGLDKAVEMALQDPNRIEEVIAFAFDPRPNVAARAAWTLRRVAESQVEKVLPWKDYLLDRLQKELIWEVRTEFCHVLSLLVFTEKEVPIIVRFFEKGMESKSRIVIAWSLNGLYEVSKKHPGVAANLGVLVRQALDSEFPAVRARARAIERDFKKRGDLL